MLKHSTHTVHSGLTIVTVPMASIQSVTVLALCNTGSRYEIDKQYGIAHFFEHMVFKGTEKFIDAHTLSSAVDAVGAGFNAFTSKEYTGYYVQSASKDLGLSLDILSDMILTPRLRQSDIDREKGVIIEELNMYVDSPQRHIANIFDQMTFKGSGLEHDIIGSKETVSSLTTMDFQDFLGRWYDLSNIVLVVAGDEKTVNSADLLEDIAHYFDKKHHPRQSHPNNQAFLSTDGISKEKLHLEHRKTEQTHFVMGWPGLSLHDPRRYAMKLLANIIGGNMSSRLFTEVREKRGLCYYVYADVDSFHDVGVIGASAGVDQKRVDEALEVTIQTFTDIASGKQPITNDELHKAKEYTAGKMVLGLEDSESVAQYFGMKQLLFGNIDSPTEVIKSYRSVTLAEVQQLAIELFQPGQLRLAVIGGYTDNDKSRFEALRAQG